MWTKYYARNRPLNTLETPRGGMLTISKKDLFLKNSRLKKTATNSNVINRDLYKQYKKKNFKCAVKKHLYFKT